MESILWKAQRKRNVVVHAYTSEEDEDCFFLVFLGGVGWNTGSSSKNLLNFQKTGSTSKKQSKKEKADEMVGPIDNRSPKVYELMTAIKRTDISPISAQSWTEHLQSHFVQPQESAPHLIPGQFNLPTRHQLLSGQLRSKQILPYDIAVPPGPGGRYRNMNTTFQRNNERAPVYELPPIHHCPEKHFKHESAVQPRF